MKKKYVKDYVPKDDSSYEYQGKYFCCNREKKERQTSGIIQLLYGGCSLVLLLLFLSFPGNGIQTLYVVLPLEIMMVCYVYHLIGSYGLLTVESRMEQRFYDKVFERPIQALTVAIILEFFSLLGQAIGVIMQKKATGWDVAMEGLLLLHFLLSLYFWNRQRKEMRFVKEEKDNCQGME